MKQILSPLPFNYNDCGNEKKKKKKTEKKNK